jgi:hypothetical protein
MKRNIIIIFFILVLSLYSTEKAFSQLAVFDPTNYFVAIDTLYSTYDQIMNTVEMIRTQYEQLQYAIEQAKTWDLNNMQWDGDWDFRNELHNVTASINRQVNNIRMIEYNLTKRKISLGGYSYTLADLVGVGEGDNLIDALDNTYSWMQNDVMKNAVAGFANRMTDEQKRAVMRKYGLSPTNYIYLQEKKKAIGELVSTVSSWGIAETIEANIQELEESVSPIIDAAMSEDSTEKSLLQQLILLYKRGLEETTNLETIIGQIGALIAHQQALEQEQAMIKQEEEAAFRQRNSSTTRGSLFMSTQE